MTKVELRKKIKALLSDSVETFPKASEFICQRILNSEIYKKSSIILSYMALADEVNLDSLMEQALKDGKKVYVPRIIPNSSQMDFYEKTYDSELNYYGIKEPLEFAPKFQIKNYDEEILFLIPGRAFSLEGARLGRGKGYYDTYISKLKSCISQSNLEFIHLAGVCFSIQIFDKIPIEKHDEKMNYIITENEFCKIFL